MKKIVRLTESDLSRIVKRVLNENMLDATAGGPITDKIEECAQDVFGPGILPKIPTCVWLAQYHLSTKKDHFDKNDKYDKVKVPACRRELEKAESTGTYTGAVYGYTDLMNCIFNCISCFGRQDVANF
jgi:hypothetical protein